MSDRHLRLLPPLYKWQRWPRGYEPSDSDLIAMTDEEYDAWAEQEYGYPPP